MLSALWPVVVLLVQRLATDWTVRESNYGGGEFFRLPPDTPWSPPNILYNGHQVIPVSKVILTL